MGCWNHWGGSASCKVLNFSCLWVKMSAKLLHSISDENPDLQKQIGCMNGIFQLFHHRHFLSSRRIHQNQKRLPPGSSFYIHGNIRVSMFLLLISIKSELLIDSSCVYFYDTFHMFCRRLIYFLKKILYEQFKVIIHTHTYRTKTWFYLTLLTCLHRIAQVLTVTDLSPNSDMLSFAAQYVCAGYLSIFSNFSFLDLALNFIFHLSEFCTIKYCHSSVNILLRFVFLFQELIVWDFCRSKR